MVGDSVCQFISSIFLNPREIRRINQIFISLIPKVDHLEFVTQFRPISLCNVMYKLVTKTVANKLKRIMPILVAPTQCGFIKGRTSSNNIIIAQEVIHKMHHLRGNKGFMAIKIDLEKAYDKLDWNFVNQTLQEVGVSAHLRNLIWHCISTSSMNVLWNGEPTEEFFSCRGIHQGDPLSPYLFVPCIERLSHLIQTSIFKGFWKPIFLSPRGPPLTHLCFADDLFILAESSLSQVEVIKFCLDTFATSSS